MAVPRKRSVMVSAVGDNKETYTFTDALAHKVLPAVQVYKEQGS